MTTTRRLLSSLAAAALAAGLLVACGEHDDPASAAGSEATATAPNESSDGGGATAAPSPPDVPKPDPADYAGMDEHTDEGAEQAFRYYFDLATWGHQSGDATDLKTLQTKECKFCTALVGDIEEIGNAGTQWSKLNISDGELAHEKLEGYEQAVSYSFTMGEHDEPVAGSSERHGVAATTYVAVGGLTWRDGGWRVDEVSSDSFGG